MGIYAPFDYVIYLGILLLVYYFFLKVVFTRLRLDKKFLLATLPYIVLGVLIRVLADTPQVEASQYWSITPGVYLVTISLGLLFLYLGLKLNKERYWVFPFSAGSLGSIFLFYRLIPFIHHPERMFFPLALALAITLLVYLISKGANLRIFQKLDNTACIFAHLLDGCATFVAYNFYGFGEEHLLPLYLINLAGNNAGVMIPVKLILILGALYLIEKYAEKEEGKVIKLMIFILGIGPGLRDIILPSLRLF